MTYPTPLSLAWGAGSGTHVGAKNTIPVSSAAPLASWNDGFPDTTLLPVTQGGVPPEGQDFNGVLNALSQHAVYGNLGGKYKFSSALAASTGYGIGAVVQDAANPGVEWQSLCANNAADPGTGPFAITASCAAGVLSVSATSGTMLVGQSVAGAGIPINTTILSFGTGTGGTGTYNLSSSPGTVASESMSVFGWATHVGSAPSLKGATSISQERKNSETVSLSEFGGDPTGLTSSYAAFVAATTAKVSDLFAPAGTYLIDTNLSIPATMTLRLAQGAILKVATGVTLTFSGNLIADPHPAFSLVGTGKVVFGAIYGSEIFPEWWSVSTTTDWSVPINLAIVATTNVATMAQDGSFSTASGVAARIKLQAKMYHISFPIKMTDKTMIIGSGYRTIITLNSGFSGSAAIVNYNDFVGGTAGGILTITTMNAGSIYNGQLLSSGTYDPASAGTGAAVTPGVYITSPISGTGGTGTYGISAPSLSVSSQNLQSLDLTSNATAMGSLHLRDLQVWDNTGGILNTMGVSWLSADWDSAIKNVTIGNFDRCGLKLDACYGIHGEGVYSYSCSKQGGPGQIWLTSTSVYDRTNAVSFDGCKVENSPVGIFGMTVDHCGNFKITNSISQSNGYGISFMDTDTAIVDNCYMEDLDREIQTTQYNGASTCRRIRVSNTGFARATYTQTVLLDGCIGTVLDNISTGTPTVAIVSATTNASRWEIRNSPGYQATVGGVGVGNGRTSYVKEDFVGASLSNIWAVTGVGTTTISSISGGAVTLTTGASNGNSQQINLGTGLAFLPGANFSVDVRARLNSVTDITFKPISFENGTKLIRVYVNDAGSAGNMLLEVNDGTDNVIGLATTIDTNWHVYHLEVLNGTVSVWIDGSFKNSTAIHVPTVGLNFTSSIATGTNLAKSMDIDYISIDMDRVVAP